MITGQRCIFCNDSHMGECMKQFGDDIDAGKGRKLRAMFTEGSKAQLYDSKNRPVGPEFPKLEGLISYVIKRGWSI